MTTSILLALAMLASGSPKPISIARTVDALQRGRTVTIAGEELCARRLLPLFYERRGLDAAWSGARADQLLATIRAAEGDGLNPEDYHLEALIALHRSGDDAEAIDLLLTDAFLLLGSDLLTGKVDPKSVTSTWCLPSRAGDVVEALENALEHGNIAAALDMLRPRHRGYRELRTALATYREIEKRGGWEVIAAGPSLRLGASGERVRALVARLRASGDLAAGSDPAQFSEEIERAVAAFQRRHGLDDDGVVGPATLRALNVLVDDRIAEIGLNLERLRWLPDPGRRFAVINIAAFELTVVEDGRIALRMRVVVGKPFQRTPVFSSTIREVVFSPYWNVPASIARNEIWPKAQRDPSYLAREHMEVLAGGRLRQRPGPWNALGGVKFVAPNPHGVYLHDTPARALFERSSRAFSHGCMRLQLPYDLAAYLLRDDAQWTRAAIEAAAATGRERSVRVREPLPLHVLYWTAWVDEQRVLHFREDVYRRNEDLRIAMRRGARRR